MLLRVNLWPPPTGKLVRCGNSPRCNCNGYKISIREMREWEKEYLVCTGRLCRSDPRKWVNWISFLNFGQGTIFTANINRLYMGWRGSNPVVSGLQWKVPSPWQRNPKLSVKTLGTTAVLGCGCILLTRTRSRTCVINVLRVSTCTYMYDSAQGCVNWPSYEVDSSGYTNLTPTIRYQCRARICVHRTL